MLRNEKITRRVLFSVQTAVSSQEITRLRFVGATETNLNTLLLFPDDLVSSVIFR